MHSFSIDFITGNTASFYNKDLTLENDTENQGSTQETSANDSYFNTTQNFEDIYSVISKDTGLSTESSDYMYTYQNSIVPPSRYTEPVYFIQNQNAATKDTDMSTRSPANSDTVEVHRSPDTQYVLHEPETNDEDSVLTATPLYSNFLIQNSDVISPTDDITVTSPGSNNEIHIISEESPDSEYLAQTPDSLERGTPSPTQQDSGIESTGSSPQASDRSTEDVSQTLEDLEKTATKVTSATKNTDKPGLSYIALIAQAILSTRDNKMSLGDIYKHIRDNHGYYDNEDKAWRNSIRYNLSINECFIKAGKEESGKGNYWAIHPICLTDFAKGDYRRRQARRRARRGTRTLDLDTAQPRNVTYAAMTPSFIGYHPYGSTGMVPVHPYSMTSPAQLYQSQKSAFTPTPAVNIMQGKPMYPGTSAYPGYPNFMTTPYSYMGNQTFNQKSANSHTYLPGDSNSLVIQ